MALPLLSNPRSWTGHWWLPEDSVNKVPGVLTWEPGGGLTLRMIGGWPHREVTEPVRGVRLTHDRISGWPAVYGVAENKPITLLNVQTLSAQTYHLGMSEGPDKLDVIAATALIGYHLGGDDDPVFVGGIATIENMTAWSRQSAIENQMTFDVETSHFEGGEIRYNSQIESQRAEMLGVTAQLHHFLTVADFEQTRGSTAIRVVERTSVEFSSAEPRPLREWLGMLSDMSDLLSLSTLTACTEITLHVWTPPTPEAYPDNHPLAHMRHQIEVYEERVVAPAPDEKVADLRRFVLTLDDLPFDELIPRWMDVKDKFAAARSMILGLSYITDGYLQTRVITAVGAAEAFHRALNVGAPMTKSEFEQVRKDTLGAVEPERKKWLAEQIARNEPSLRNRLLDLARRPGIFMALLVPDAEKWAKEAMRARNGLSHEGRSEGHSLDDLNALVEVTRAVVILNLLAQLGVPAERLALGLQEHPVLSYAMRLGKERYATDAETA